MELKMVSHTEAKPHVVLVPLMAQGHMIPMTDIAHLLANRHASVTLVTTPVNAARISTIINRVEQSGLPISFVSLQFPTIEFGLPEGCENMDMLPSRHLLPNFFDAVSALQDPLILHLRTLQPPPTCIISDNALYWVRDVAREFGIPWLVFHGYGCFPLLCIRNLRPMIDDEEVKDGYESFVVPGLPSKIEVTRAQLPRFFAISGMDRFCSVMREAELASDGVVLNTFNDLETLYLELYERSLGKKVWTIGPLSLSNGDVVDMAPRGSRASIDEDRLIKWLDSMKPSSVIYVSFGSLAHTNPLQLIEVGLGLEASQCSFIWVIKAGERFSEVEEWLSVFGERTHPRGLIIRGWAPQLVILSHEAVGGFMTHCGWNSMLESVSTGVPMITWPYFGEQFLNEKLVVEVLRIGVPIGVKVRASWKERTNDILVKKDDVDKAVQSLFSEDKKVEEMRKRCKDLVEKARKAVEGGGSSYGNLMELIRHIKASNCKEEKEENIIMQEDTKST